MHRWKSRVALVTGASEGLGRAMAKELVKQGMKVVGCARNLERLQQLQTQVKEFSGQFTPVKCDLRKENEISDLFAKIKKDFDHLDVCINNAGLEYNEPILTGKSERWREMLEVNVLALSICTREAVQLMREAGIDDGHIIQISSMSGYRLTGKEEHFYAVTKHGVKVITEGTRVELRELGSHIRVTAISPGNVGDTEIVRRSFPDDKERGEECSIPKFRWMDPKDIVDAMLYVLGAPPHVQVHDILLRPTEQEK